MPVTLQGFVQPGQISPIAQMGQNILLKVAQQFRLYRVNFLEQIPPSSPMMVNFITAAIGNIAANGILAGQSLQTPMQMSADEIGHFRMKLLDDIELAVYEPQNLPRFVIQQARARLTYQAQRIIDHSHALSEVFVFQDNYPFVDVYNPSQYIIYAARIAVYGFRYQVKEIQRTIDLKEITSPYTAAMGEGFSGLGYQRVG